MPSTSQSQSQQQRPKYKKGKLYFNGLELCYNFNNDTGCSRRMLNETHCVDDRNFKRVHGCTWLQNGGKPCGLHHKKNKSFCCNKQVILCSIFVLFFKTSAKIPYFYMFVFFLQILLH